MDDPTAVSVLAGASAVPTPFCRPLERRHRKTGTADIFQGVNLRQLRRLFLAAGDRDAESKAQQVWGREGGRGGEEEEGEMDEEEVEAGLAQALVGLRVRARNRSGIRAEPHRDVTAGTKRCRAISHYRSEGSPRQPADVTDDEEDNDDDATEIGASGGLDTAPWGSDDQEVALSLDDGMRGASAGPSWGRNVTPERDPERYLHRIRH